MARATDHTHAPSRTDEATQIDLVTPEEGKSLLDAAARFYLGISGDEFIRRYNAGKFQTRLDDTDVQHLLTLRKFAEPGP